MRLLRLLILLAAAAVAGWLLGRHGPGTDAGFAERRLAFLEAENARLVGTIAERERTAEQAAGRAQRKEIEASIAGLRELEFKKEITYREIGREALPAILRQKLAQQVPEQEFADTGVALAALGLLPAGIDLQKTYLALLGEQIGAFYDQHAHELYTFSGHPLTNAANRVVMAHELTHALQDQHYDLSRLPLEAKGNDDRALAASALVEGDATLAMNQYMMGEMSSAALRDSLAQALTTDVRQLVAAPRFLRETLLFPYQHGLTFCQTLYESGGWAGLAAAFARPPASTAQILHPEKYPSEEPIAVDLPEATVLGRRPLMRNVLGEFGARELFTAWLHDDARAMEAAAGWRGDGYIVYGDARASSYVWRVVCRDQATTEAFASAARDCLAKRRGAGSGWKVDVAPENTLTVIDAQNAEWAKALVEQFAPGMRVGQ